MKPKITVVVKMCFNEPIVFFPYEVERDGAIMCLTKEGHSTTDLGYYKRCKAPSGKVLNEGGDLLRNAGYYDSHKVHEVSRMLFKKYVIAFNKILSK